MGNGRRTPNTKMKIRKGMREWKRELWGDVEGNGASNTGKETKEREGERQTNQATLEDELKFRGKRREGKLPAIVSLQNKRVRGREKRESVPRG